MNRIQKTICREELKSRIPALFAYIEENDAGEFKLHKATDSLQGCYGKIVENIKLPEGENAVNLVIDGETLLSAGETYSYRTLIDYYYQYKDYVMPEENEEEDENYDLSFIAFIDRAIGKVEINLEELELNEADNDLVPHYIYLSNVRRLFSQYSKLKVIYDYYTDPENHTEGDDKFDVNTLESDICCTCLKYRRMGGTKMYEKIESLFEEADSIADEYYGYAETGKLTLNLNVSLKQSIHDMGYLSCYLNEWVGGDKHFCGELYTYDGNTYMCMQNNNDTYDPETMTFIFNADGRDFKRITEIDTWPECIGGERIKWILSDNQFGNMFRFYEEQEESGEQELVEKDEYELSGTSDSKLMSMRAFKEYISGDDKAEKPANGEDWLYYYREGVVVSYTTTNDALGNIADVEELNNGKVVAAHDAGKLARRRCRNIARLRTFGA